MTVYLSGKITGDPDYKAKFSDAREKLTDMGYVVFDTAVLPETDEWSRSDYMSVSLKIMSLCVAACFLPDWKDSSDTREEYNYAVGWGLKILNYDELD